MGAGALRGELWVLRSHSFSSQRHGRPIPPGPRTWRRSPFSRRKACCVPNEEGTVLGRNVPGSSQCSIFEPRVLQKWVIPCGGY